MAVICCLLSHAVFEVLDGVIFNFSLCIFLLSLLNSLLCGMETVLFPTSCFGFSMKVLSHHSFVWCLT